MFGHPLGTLNGASDLAARSIQRGRENGFPSYTRVRELVGLSKPSNWNDITTDTEVIDLLKKLYDKVDDVDLYVGGLAEDKIGSSIVGSLYSLILNSNFQRIRDGDRFWFENNQFSNDELKEILDTRFADIIKRNTDLTEYDLPQNVFYKDKRFTTCN